MHQSAPPSTRSSVLQRLPRRAAIGRPIIGAGAGNGLSANLGETGMSYQLEVDCVRAAHELDLLTQQFTQIQFDK